MKFVGLERRGNCRKHFSTCECIYIRPVIRKGKTVPLQAWSGPEGSRKLRFPDFMTTAQEGGKFVSLYPPGNPPGTHLC